VDDVFVVVDVVVDVDIVDGVDVDHVLLLMM